MSVPEKISWAMPGGNSLASLHWIVQALSRACIGWNRPYLAASLVALEKCANAVFTEWQVHATQKSPVDDRQYFDLLCGWLWSLINLQTQAMQMIQATNQYRCVRGVPFVDSRGRHLEQGKPILDRGVGDYRRTLNNTCKPPQPSTSRTTYYRAAREYIKATQGNSDAILKTLSPDFCYYAIRAPPNDPLSAAAISCELNEEQTSAIYDNLLVLKCSAPTGR